MLWKAYRYKWLDFTDLFQHNLYQIDGYSYLLQDVIKDTTTRTEVTNKANFHGWFSSETLVNPRLLTFTWKVVWLTKEKRHLWFNALVSAIKPEWNPNIQNRGFYELQFQDDNGTEKVLYAKVFTPPTATNWLSDPVIEYSFELLCESEKVYGATIKTETGWQSYFGGMTLPTTLPTTFWWFVWSLEVENEWNWIAPCKIQVVGTATNPKVYNLTNWQKYRLWMVTENLVLDNRNINNNPTENFIVTNNWFNVKSWRLSWSDIFLQPWVNNIAVISDDPSEIFTVTITYRDTYIY